MSKNILKVFALALFLGLWFQGVRPFMGRDEHRYPVIAREMLHRGEYLVPYFKGHPHLTKPPLIYWAVAAGEKLLGENPWGARLPNALALAITAAALSAIGVRLFGDPGWLAGLLYALTLTPFAAANIVTPDTLLVMWEVLAAWAFFRGSFLCWIFWGLAFMTKGTATLPVMAPFLWYGWVKRKDWRGLFLGAFLFSLVALPWYIYIQSRFPDFWRIFLQEQVTGRLFHNYYHRNSAWYAPLYIYLPLLTLGALPGALYFFRDLPRLPDFFRASLFNRVVAMWYAFPLVVFFLAKSRLPLYILPLFPPFVLMTVGLRRERPLSLRFLILWGLFLLALKAGLSWYLKTHVIFGAK